MKIAILLTAAIMWISTTELRASQIPEETLCLALNIYHEARSKTLAGQVAVGNVTLNRVESDRFPDTVCGVVFQEDQFSWYWDGKSDVPREKEAWETAKLVAIAMLDSDSAILDNTDGALFYHADYVSPFWSKIFEPIKKIGPHIFYVDNTSE